MRKVSLAMNVSLDGYVAGPNGELDWIFRSMDPALGESVISFLREVDTILIGHTTYLQQAAAWPKQSGEMADLLNSHAKVVFSTRLTIRKRALRNSPRISSIGRWLCCASEVFRLLKSATVSCDAPVM